MGTRTVCIIYYEYDASSTEKYGRSTCQSWNEPRCRLPRARDCSLLRRGRRHLLLVPSPTWAQRATLQGSLPVLTATSTTARHPAHSAAADSCSTV